MKLSSPAFTNMEDMPARFTCDGDGVSPTLEISDVPENAQSLMLVIDDPDAPKGDFVHWVLFNIDPRIEAIPEDSVPADSVQAATSAGKRGFVPFCPPSGTHRYFFRLYALNTALDLPDFITADQLLHRVKGHVRETAELVGLYSRVEAKKP